ncbi:MAG: hypothetical protein JWN67_4090 [Actinomycetia bacterium]|nr:hypothetical protein [Actinomycetes bacterium]
MPDDRIADLYGLPAGEFTAARDALAKALRAEGDKAAAAEVKALRRPTVAAWAVNQVARDRPELVDALAEAGTRLVAAQEHLLAGGGRDDLRAATTARRDAVNAATRAAVELAGPAQRDAVHATFDAAATDEEAAVVVRSGRLAKELEPPSSFALLGDGVFATPEPEPEPEPDVEPEPEPDPEPEVDPALVAEAETRLEAARAEVEAATAERAEAAERLATAGERLEAAERAVAEAEERLGELNDQREH